MAQFMWSRSPPEFSWYPNTVSFPAEGSDHQISYVEQNTGMKIFFRCIGNTVLGLMLVMALVLLIPGLSGSGPMWSIPDPWNLRSQPELWFYKGRRVFSEKGDIITFHNGDTVVTHRVVKKEKDIFITKGDANKTEDPVPAEASQIIGRVVFHLPYLGYVIHFLKARIPFAAVCIAACLSVLFDLAYTPKRKKYREEFNHDEKQKTGKRNRTCCCDHCTGSRRNSCISHGF